MRDVDIDQRLYGGGALLYRSCPLPSLDHRPSDLNIGLVCKWPRSAEKRMLRVILGYLGMCRTGAVGGGLDRGTGAKRNDRASNGSIHCPEKYAGQEGKWATAETGDRSSYPTEDSLADGTSNSFSGTPTAGCPGYRPTEGAGTQHRTIPRTGDQTPESRKRFLPPVFRTTPTRSSSGTGTGE
jgi:hypothetical protein